MSEFKKVLRLLSAPENLPLLTNIQRGIEKESLRVTPDGALATTRHPPGLGSALTHPRITTDFSEALIELITPPGTDTGGTLKILEELHQITYRNIGDELLWASSMPCAVSNDSAIPIARYGSSNIARMKEVYRTGLGNRYGRLMQTIAGIHFNWSIPDECLSLIQAARGQNGNFQAFKTDVYFRLIRNFRRHTWLLLYLFGAAPAVCSCFVRGRGHRLVPLKGDDQTLYAPYGTSLRMGDLGYQSAAQEALYICYNNLDSYISTLRQALATPYPAYEEVGVRGEDGEYRQLSTHVLQIENEFYSTVRPKRTTRSGETPLKALRERGIEYVEVRCLDLNPFLSLGIDREQSDFLDIFLLYNLLADSSDMDRNEFQETLDNQLGTVYEGRKPGFELRRAGAPTALQVWGDELFDNMDPVAELLDNAFCQRRYRRVLGAMRARLGNSGLTPSAQILDQLGQRGCSYFHWGLEKSREHKAAILARRLDGHIEQTYREMAERSLLHQQQIEAADTTSFDEYLGNYYAQHRL